MRDWLQGFYDDPALRDTLMRSFLPVFSNYVSEATGGPVAAEFVRSLAESYVDRHLGSSRAQLQEVVGASEKPLADLAARFEEWEEKRPGKVARNELVRSANAASVEKMREAGVTKMVWRASGGKTCPFCTELDGTVIEVTGTFFEAGDELNPEGATAPIHFESSLGHPPVHQGCVCSVEAVTETEQGEVGNFQSLDEASTWLQSKGLNRPDAAIPDLDPKTFGLEKLPLSFVNRMTAELDRLDRQFPGVVGSRSFNIVGASDKAFGDEAGQFFGRAMLFSTKRLGTDDLVAAFERSAARDAFDTIRSVETLVQHEFGHATDFWFRTTWIQNNPLGDDWVTWYERRGAAGTDYGKKNRLERFAEFTVRAQNLPETELTPWERDGLPFLRSAGFGV